MSTMYSRSVAMLRQAKNAILSVSEDDAFLDVACFETQQAVEFLIKAILLENGIPYDKSHDIRYLLVLLEEIPFTFEKQEALELLASTITDWEESSRYGKGVRTTVQTIQRVHNIYESMNQAFLKTQEDLSWIISFYIPNTNPPATSRKPSKLL